MCEPQWDQLEEILDTLFASTPLMFIKEFLRTAKKTAKGIQIGQTAADVRANIRDAVLARKIGMRALTSLLQEVEGWGRQHLYIGTIRVRSLAHPHILNAAALTSFLTKRGLYEPPAAARGTEPSAHRLDHLDVDDVLVRLTWRSYGYALERHEELDEVRELEDGEYEFHAYKRLPRSSVSRLILRKTDGLVLLLIDLPMGKDHDALKETILETGLQLLAPLNIEFVYLSPVVGTLDSEAVRSFERQGTGFKMSVAPTQARYRTDGARLEFKSTSQGTGYTASRPVREVRRAMQVKRFEGEAGKFRLTFTSEDREPHDMIVSLNAADNRVFLFSRMDEREVFALVDQLMNFVPR